MRIEVHFVSGAVRIYNFRIAPHTISWYTDEGKLDIEHCCDHPCGIKETEVNYFIVTDANGVTKYERQTHSKVDDVPDPSAA